MGWPAEEADTDELAELTDAIKIVIVAASPY